MTMKTPDEWLAEYRSNSGVGGKSVPILDFIAAIQADARAEAESERDKALAAAGEMRAALEMWRCGTCGGTQKFTPECQGCLSGEGPCTCGQEEEQPCPQCCASDMPGLTKEYAALEHALSTDCGKGWLPPQQVADAIAKAVAETESKSTVVKLQAKQIKMLVEALEKIKTITDDPESHVIAREALAAVKGQP